MTTVVTEVYNGSASIGTTEYSCPNAATYSSGSPITTGYFLQAWFDLANMAAGDQYQIRVYDKITSGGTQRVIYEAVITGAQAATYVMPALAVKHAWDVTLKKLAGTDRTLYWSLRAP